MPAKKRVTREDIVTAALELVRENSVSALSARSAAAALDCSTQPIFSNFSGMEELLGAVIERAWQLYMERTEAAMTQGRYLPYMASGMAYIAFAIEEPNLFKLLFMRDRVAEGDADELHHPPKVIDAIVKQTGLSEEIAQQFHSEMWVFVHGLAVLSATRFTAYREETVSGMLSDVYDGLLRHYREKGESHHG